jgi:hypothetical protein
MQTKGLDQGCVLFFHWLQSKANKAVYTNDSEQLYFCNISTEEMFS